MLSGLFWTVFAWKGFALTVFHCSCPRLFRERRMRFQLPPEFLSQLNWSWSPARTTANHWSVFLLVLGNLEDWVSWVPSKHLVERTTFASELGTLPLNTWLLKWMLLFHIDSLPVEISNLCQMCFQKSCTFNFTITRNGIWFLLQDFSSLFTCSVGLLGLAYFELGWKVHTGKRKIRRLVVIAVVEKF